MAFYLVKDDGTATGDAGRYATQQTGSFATIGVSGYYATIAAALGATTVPAGTDSIQCSDAHAQDYGASQTLAFPTTSGVSVMSVSDTNIDQYSSGASDSTTTGSMTINGSVSMSGMTISSAGNQNMGNGTYQEYYECSFSMDRWTSSGGTFSRIYLWNCDVGLDVGAASSFILFRASRFEMDGGSISTGLASINRAFDLTFDCTIQLTGVDLTACANNVFEDSETSTTRNWDVTFNNCELRSGCAITDQTVNCRGQIVRAFNTSATSADSEHQFYVDDWAGVAEDQDDTGIFRNESQAFPDGTQASIKVVTNADASINAPFIFDLPARFIDLTSASSDVVRLFFAVVNTETLTDTNVWAELIYPDGTNKQQYNRVSNRNADFLAAGTEHTDDSASSNWRDGGSALTGHNEYRMDLDTTGDAGAIGVPIVRIYIAEPSVSSGIFFDTEVGAV